jgi:ADP-ribose pyrophosphatase
MNNNHTLNFETLEHNRIYEGRVVNLYKDKIRYDEGQIEYREIVEHYGGSVILAMPDESSLILIKQYRYPIGKFVYELPAGKLNLNEDPLECAKRELKEETGYSAGDWKKIISFYTSPGYSSELLHIYLAKNLTAGEQALELGEKHIQVLTMSIEEAVQKIESEEINDGKTVIGILLGKENQFNF